MEKVFMWSGFICLLIVVFSLTFFLTIAMLDVVIKRTKFLDKVARRFAKWHTSFPKRSHHHRYAFAVYDYEEGKFLNSMWLDEEMMNDEERERKFAEWRKANARKRETAYDEGSE